MARLAPSLVRARTVIDARWPYRDRRSDGWIGDVAHQGRNSDHNPNARGIVDAIDVDMFGGTTPVTRGAIVAGFIVHPATNYVIFNRRIFQADDLFRPRVYNGINPHTEHCHCSVFQSVSAENNPAPWTMLAGWPDWPYLRKTSAGQHVRELQALLNAWGSSLACDGDFGPATDTAVRAYQARYGLAVDGIVGSETRGHLFT
jgi:hypothetical protein